MARRLVLVYLDRRPVGSLKTPFFWMSTWTWLVMRVLLRKNIGYNRPMPERRPMIAQWLLLAACVGVPASGARAQDFDKIDPAAIRFITPTASSSACVGKPTTPICGIETLIGCSHYIWNEGCEAVDRRVSSPKDIRAEYVVVKAGLVNLEKVRAGILNEEYRNHIDLSIKVFQTLILERECAALSSDCEGVPWRNRLYVVSPHKTIPGIWSFNSIGIFGLKVWLKD